MNERVVKPPLFDDVMTLADYVVDYASSILYRPVTNLHLQKILFFMQYFYCRSQYLEQKDREYKDYVFLFKDDFEAWKYGPVLKDVYKKYKCGTTTSRSLSENPWRLPTKPKELEVSEENKEFIIDGIEVLSKMPSFRLVDESHKEGGAWERARKKGDASEISKQDIICDIRDQVGYFGVEG